MKQLTTMLFAAALVAAPAALHAQATMSTGTTTTATTATTMRAGREGHPEIRDAIRSLQQARNHLDKAKHDFGGHRADAIKAIDDAIAQLRLAMQYDK